ncbi:MAG: CRTAC1 family protein [Thermoanaerobaculia bacterium]|nr:CRTAC1 family protein [Thermoanaerobaculia bacterium]
MTLSRSASSPTLSPSLPLLVLALFLLSVPSLATSSGVVFEDIAGDPDSGLSYHRVESPSESLFDIIKQQEFYTFDDLLVTPLKGRGAPGVALFDLENDGDVDIYVSNGPGAANSLFVNQLVESGDLTFIDQAVPAGVGAVDQDSTGVCAGDIDNDGDTDLVVLGNLEPNRLFENQGNGTFLDITAPSGLGVDVSSSTSCSLGDVDGDGLLDLFVGNGLDMREQFGIFVEAFAFNQPNQLLVNQGGNTFVDETAGSGVLDLDFPSAPPGAASITWAVAMVDIDLDGDVDILQADDQAAFPTAAQGGLDRGYLHWLRNDGTGNFTDVTRSVGLDKAGAWMGLSFGDLDHDGRLDLFATNFGNRGLAVMTGETDFSLRNFDSRWFLQTQTDSFADSAAAGPLFTPFGWGTSALDYDNDGHTDIVYHGGLDVGPFLATNPGVLFHNDGAGGLSRDVGPLAPSTDHTRRVVHGVATGDLDGDGDTDIVSVSNHDTPPPAPLVPAPSLGGGEFAADAVFVPSFISADPEDFIFTWSGLEFPDGSLSVELNSGHGHHRWVQVETLGTIGLTGAGQANRDGVGAVVRVRPRRGPATLHPVLAGSSYASTDSKVVSAGLGHAKRATVDVMWPGGVVNRLYNVRKGTRVLFPEIPCERGDHISELAEYLQCVHVSLHELGNAGILTQHERARFFFSAFAFFFDR